MDKRRTRIITVGAGLAAAAATFRRRRRADPAHAPGKQHRGPASEPGAPDQASTEPRRDEPWIRTTHSDSQKRRFRR